jgi:flagellar basal-body rod modification protein FlgD
MIQSIPSPTDTTDGYAAANTGTTNQNTTGSTGSATSSTAGMNGLLQPNEFLNLLVDNLKYQDPLDPTSSADLLTQLAALSQVQTQQQIAETDQTSAAANLIGDTITGADASGNPVTGVVSGFSLTSSGPTLDVGNDSVSLGDISAVSTTTAAAPSSGSSA